MTIKEKNTSHLEFFKLVYIFAAWETDAENHLLMFLLKMSRDFVVRSSG